MLPVIERLTRVHDLIRDDIRRIYDELNDRGQKAPWKAQLSSTLRNPQEQLDLWNRGRSYRNNRWVQVGRIVTRALPHQTPHCFGLAADISLLDDVTSEWLHDDDPAWNIIGEVVAKYPWLEWGGKWKFRDCAHIQLRDWQDTVGISRIERMRELWTPQPTAYNSHHPDTAKHGS